MMPVQTILTSIGSAGLYTSAISVAARGMVHAQFRVGSAVSAPSVSNMSMTVVLQAKIPGSDDLWTDSQTWAIAVAESMPGKDIDYQNGPEATEYRLGCKIYGSGIMQARLAGA